MNSTSRDRQLLPYFQSLVFLVTILLTHVAQAAIPNAPGDLTAVVKSSRAIELSWVDNASDETGFKIERSLSQNTGFESFAILEANSTYLLDHSLTFGTTYFYRISAYNEDGESSFSNVISATTDAVENEIPFYWKNTDVGNPGSFKGSATYDKGFFVTDGRGRMTETFNTFNFTYQPLHGNGEIVAKLVNMLEAHWDHQGVIIKESLEPTSPYIMTELYRDNREIVVKGRTEGGDFFYVESTEKDYNKPIWLKVERSGDTFISSVSKDGEVWEEIHRETIQMGADALIGLASHASTDDKSSTATWREVSVSNANETISSPSGLTAAASPLDEAVLQWEDLSDNETSFRIERAIKGDTIIFVDVAEVGPNSTSYQDDGLIPGKTYFYRVRAISDSIASFPSNVATVEILSIQNTIFFMPRLTGDVDKSIGNEVNVFGSKDTLLNELRHPGLIGKQIHVSMGQELSSMNGSISFKIMPNTHQQSVAFFQSPTLKISQEEDKLAVTANGIERTYNVFLDSISCNHVVLRFDEGTLYSYVNGSWIDTVAVGSFTIPLFTLGTYNGNIWDVRLIADQISDDAVYELSEHCTNGVEPATIPDRNYPFRHCGPYTCLWVEKESDLSNDKKRGYLKAQDIAYDKNTFDVGMFFQPDIDEWVNRKRDVPSSGFDYFTPDNILPRDQGNTAYWLHENFHGYQRPLYKGGKWLAEASANWAAWNFYKSHPEGRGIGLYTLNPHIPLLGHVPGKLYARYYHSSILLTYITAFVSDEAFIGRLYNTPAVAGDPVQTIASLLAKEGYDFDEVFAEFIARTVVWDYPEKRISDEFKANELISINNGDNDYRFVEVLPVEGTYGVLQPGLEELLPGSYAWNTYKIDSTASKTYTITLTGSSSNLEGKQFVGKVVTGVEGAYTYHDLPVDDAVALGQGVSTLEVELESGQQLFLVIANISKGSKEEDIKTTIAYSFGIESSEHPLPNDHIKTFVLDEQSRRAIIDHDQHTVSVEVERGTDPTKLRPTITLSEGATSDPASGVELDFSEPVIYQVTGSGNSSPKEWTVTVDVIPPRTGTDILSFELEDLAPFATINNNDRTVVVNLISDIDLSSVTPVFTLSDGATSQPASGETIDLSNPVTYKITAEDGVTKRNWIVSAAEFRPFISSWETSSSKEVITIKLSDNYDYDFKYTWKDANGAVVKTDTAASPTSSFSATLPSAGIYTLEIIGAFPNFSTDSKQKLTDILQWGDIPWRDMANFFSGWKGTSFSATDQPNLTGTVSMYSMFNRADQFNGDISKWDVSNVSDMSGMFQGAKAFNSDLSAWNVGNVRNMQEMFREANAFNGDVSSWNVGKVVNMNRMFFSTREFDNNLGQWDMHNVGDMYEMLRSSNLSRANYDRTLIGWANQNIRSFVELGAHGLVYCAGEEARTYLEEEKKWIITDGGLECSDDEADILSFILAEQDGFVVIDDASHTISANALAGTDITQLTPTIMLSKGATSSPASGEAVDFTNPVVYSVTSKDNTNTQDWTITVTAEPILSIGENETEIQVYPNPVQDILRVKTSQKVKVYLLDLSGNALVANHEGYEIEMDMSGLKSGIYLLVIEDGSKKFIRKVIKQD